MTVTSDEAIGDDRDRDRADGESFSELAERSIKSNIIRETKCGIHLSQVSLEHLTIPSIGDGLSTVRTQPHHSSARPWPDALDGL